MLIDLADKTRNKDSDPCKIFMTSIGRLLVYYTAILIVQESCEKAIRLITETGENLCTQSRDFLALANLKKLKAMAISIQIEKLFLRN